MSEAAPVRVAAVQMSPKLGAVVANTDAILGRLEEASRSGARLVVFPECALTGYGFDSREDALRCAGPIPGGGLLPIHFACARTGVHAVVGLLERAGNHLYNACVLIGPTGVVGLYRKVHLPFMGVDRFADPGDRPFAVHEAAGLRIGLHLCYDGGFPEVGRVLTLLGADLLVLPTNWPSHAVSAVEHLMAARAFENHVYAMAVNRVGTEGGFRFIGGSSIVAPGGAILVRASAESEEIIAADVDPARARAKRLVRTPGANEMDRIADRRPGFYRPITDGNGRWDAC